MPRKTTTAKKTTAKRKTTTTRKKTTTTARKSSANTKSSQKMVLGNPGELNDMIREKAYELYKQRGGWHGSDVEDWLEAEREVRRELVTA